ncbi:MAG: DUF167 domain-containing protein [Candidatus Wolfebacteria bacterium]|nr:DUF167 domain-containing protein [Candidatus Wolfebacteria bacterium]
MTIFVKVKTGAKTEAVEKIDENHYEVITKEAPEKGRANAAVKELLAKHFKVAKSMVEIKAGHTAKQKIIKINY